VLEINPAHAELGDILRALVINVLKEGVKLKERK